MLKLSIIKMVNFGSLLKPYQQRVNQALNILLPKEGCSRLSDAMRYSVVNSGKRLRPILVYMASELGEEENKEAADNLACAVELIHCYSLIHDDLPSMDNDQLRRGKPTCHLAFGEATAILAGDALQPLAYSLISDCSHISSDLKIEILKRLSFACGWNAMVEGQMKDITAKEDFNILELDLMHGQKTGELIKTSLEIGGLLANLDLEKLSKLSSYGEKIGLAFQITDDIIDIESPSELSGKNQGSDLLHNKTTYPSLIGLEASKKRAKELVKKAEQDLNIFSTKSTKLRKLAQFIIQRDH